MRIDLVPVPGVLLDRLTSLGVDVEQVLRLSGLARSRFQAPKARLSTSEFFALWRAMERVAGAADFGLRLGSSRMSAHYDVVSMAALHSPTLGEALKKLARYKRLVCPEQVNIEVAAGEAVVFVAAAAQHRRAAFDAVDYMMDRLKSEAALWKKESGSGGSAWVEPTEADAESLKRWS